MRTGRPTGSSESPRRSPGGGSGTRCLPLWVFKIGSRFNPMLAEAAELLPRYRGDNVFDTAKFASRFPDFAVTTYEQGIGAILTEPADRAH